MKKILFGLFAATALFTGVMLFNHDAHAGVTRGMQGYSQQPVYTRAWESLGVAAGAVINSPVLSLDNTDECEVIADNSLGGSTRNILVTWLGQDGTTVLYQQTVALLTTTRGIVNVSSNGSTASLPSGVTVLPVPTGRKMSFSLSSAGAAAGSLAVYCR